MKLLLVTLLVSLASSAAITYTTSCTPNCGATNSEDFRIAGGASAAAAAPDAPMYVARGDTLTVTVGSGVEHPFGIHRSSGNSATNDRYSVGVTNQGSNSGSVTFVVPVDAPDRLNYQCEVHPAMTGPIEIGDVLLLGSTQVPAVVSTAAGAASCVVNWNNGDAGPTLSYNVRFSGVVATQAHFHEGAPGTNGAVMLDIGAAGLTSPLVSATTTITTAQAKLLTSGNAYVNIHSAANNGGELRGNVVCRSINQRGTIPLRGSSQRPTAVETVATGSNVCLVNFGSISLLPTADWSVTFQGTSSAVTGTHFHQGNSTAIGGVILDMGGNSGLTSPSARTGFAIDTNIATLLATSDGAYTNLHTTNFPDGEIRGSGACRFINRIGSGRLEGQEQPVPITNSDGRGDVTCTVHYNGNGAINVDYRVSWAEINATAIHFHSGARGAEGVIILDVGATSGLTSPSVGTAVTITQAVADTLTSGNAYLNLHTAANANGELRTQITCSFDGAVGKALVTGAQATPTPVVTNALGYVTCSVDTSGASPTLTYSLRFSGLSGPANAIHFHGPAPPAVEAPVLVDVGAVSLISPINSPAPVTINAATATALTNGNAYINVHTVAWGSGEIRGQVRCATGAATRAPTRAPSSASAASICAMLLLLVALIH